MVLNTFLRFGKKLKTFGQFKVPYNLPIAYINSKTTDEFVFQDSAYPAYEDTFQFWVVKNFRSNSKYISYHKSKPKNINGPSYQGVLDSICFQSDRLMNSQKHFEESLNQHIVESESLEPLLEIIDVYLTACPSRIIKSKVYNSFLRKLPVFLTSDKNSIHRRLQCAYYASLAKKSKVSQNLVQTFVKTIGISDLKLLNEYELGIFCNILFRTSVTLNENFLNYIGNYLKSKFHSVILQPAVLLCYIKSMRHNRYYDIALFQLLDNHVVDAIPLKLTSKVHLLAYYSDVLYPKVDLVVNLINSCIDEIDTMIENGLAVRSKDLDTTLWSSSNYNDQRIKSRINKSQIPKYFKFLGNTQLRSKVNETFNTLLWLWILECEQRNELCKYFVTLNNIRIVKGMKNFKDTAKLYLLLSCVRIEAPNLLPTNFFNEMDNKLTPRISNYLAKRPVFERIYKTVINTGNKWGIKNVRCEFRIPSLYIAGITAEDKRGKFSIEVLDDTVCLRDSLEPNGMMALKLRLMKAEGIRTLIVNPSKLPEGIQLGEMLANLGKTI